MISALSSEDASGPSSLGPGCPGTGDRTARSAVAPQVSSCPGPAAQQVLRGLRDSPLILTTFYPLSLGDLQPSAFRMVFGYFLSKRLQFRVHLPRAGSHVLRNTGPAEPPSFPSGPGTTAASSRAWGPPPPLPAAKA